MKLGLFSPQYPSSPVSVDSNPGDYHYSYTRHHRLTTPFIIAHRGGAALAPENTIQGWEYVRKMYGPDVFELDVRVSRDGHLVVIHDRKVDRTTNGQGKVSELPLGFIKLLDAGYRFSTDEGKSYPWRGKGVRIPTLVEILDAFPRDRFNIEIKKVVPGIELQLAAIIGERNLTEQVLVLSRDADMLIRLRHLDPRIETAAVISEKTIIARVAVPSMKPIIKRLIRRAHSRGVRVEVWTVNDRETIRMLLEMGVDGIVTDYPDLASRVFHKMGLRSMSALRPILHRVSV